MELAEIRETAYLTLPEYNQIESPVGYLQCLCVFEVWKLLVIRRIEIDLTL